ncbi:hypothetical protein, partial [Pseudomonas cichorii]|uniref:hypothetical protein n=1 Tax=Pseudomonas cichorii TaxID=36746 RepID=UPI001C7EB83C
SLDQLTHMPEIFRIRLMFEWGGGALWCGNEAALARFSVGPIEEKLPLSSTTLERLDEMTCLHDRALNWDYPPDPGTWSAAEYIEFDDAAETLLAVIQEELGIGFEVVYERVSD